MVVMFLQLEEALSRLSPPLSVLCSRDSHLLLHTPFRSTDQQSSRTSERPCRSIAGSWKDGHAKDKESSFRLFVTKSRSQKQRLLMK